MRLKGPIALSCLRRCPPITRKCWRATERGIPVLDRREFLGALLGRAIARSRWPGTHGKTTTSGMIATVLRAAGLDPSYIVGGVLQDLGTNATAGAGEWFVIEADEYGRMFLGLTPEIAVVTIIEMDHPDCFADIDDMRRAYRRVSGSYAAGWYRCRLLRWCRGAEIAP